MPSVDFSVPLPQLLFLLGLGLAFLGLIIAVAKTRGFKTRPIMIDIGD